MKTAFMDNGLVDARASYGDALSLDDNVFVIRNIARGNEYGVPVARGVDCAQCEMFAALARLIARVIAFLRHDGLADSR